MTITGDNPYTGTQSDSGKNKSHRIINTTDIGTIFLDLNLNITIYTPSASIIFNLPSNIHGQPVNKIADQLGYNNLVDDVKIVIERLNEIEKEIYLKNEQVYLFRLTPYRTDENHINGLFITFINITESKRAEEFLKTAENLQKSKLEELIEKRTEELKKSRDLYFTLVENTPDVITRWNKDLQLLFANPALEVKTGISNNMLLGKNIFEFGVGDEMAVLYSESLKKEFATGKTVEHYNYFDTPAGKAYFYSRITPEKNLVGEVETLIAIARNITELTNAVQEIKNKQELLQATMDSSPEMIQVFEAIRDTNGEIIDFKWILNNHASEEVYGDVIGKSLLTLNPGVITEGIFETFKQVVETGEPSMHERHYSHEQFDDWYYQSAVKLNDGVVTTTINISNVKKAQQEAKTSQELLQSVIDSSLDVIQAFKSVRDENGKIIDFTWVVQNEKGFLQNGEVIGESVLQKNPGMVDSGIFARLVEVTETGIPQELEQYYSFEQFSEKWFYLAMVKQDDGVVMTTRDITEQIKAKSELLSLKDELAQKATDKYLGLFNSIDEGFCIIEVLFNENQKPCNWKFLEVNPAFEKNNGLYNAKGKTIIEMAPDIEPKWFEIYGSVAKTQQPLRFKEHSVALNRHFDLYAFPVDEAEENHVAVIFTDITQRIYSEEAVRNSEERLRVTMESVVDFVIITMDINGIIQHWNTGAERTFGYSMNEVKGKPFEIIFTHEDQALNIPDLELQAAGEKGYAEDERWHMRKDGSKFFMSGMTRPIYNPELIGFVKVARDMTEQRQAAEQLRLLEERYRIALESAGMAAWDWNIKENKMLWNDNHYKLLGLTVPDNNQTSAPDFIQFIHPEDASLVTDAFKQAMETGEVYNAEYRIVRANDGSILWMKSYGSTVSYENDKATRMVGVVFDITEQKLFTEELSRLVTERTLELQRSNDDLRQFAHVASHDLKEPVRKIRTFNNRILDEFENVLPPVAKTYLDRIESASARMYAMIEGVLHYSKLGIESNPLENVDMNEIIEQIKTDLEVMIEQKHAEIITNNLPIIKADNTLIYQLFYNLILNSLKFSMPDESTKIEIVTSIVTKDDTEYFEIVLIDNGIGFQPQYSKNIFNTFTRLNSADLYEGTGLGLALCKKIVERYNGLITANGEPDKGSTFTILFPTKNNN